MFTFLDEGLLEGGSLKLTGKTIEGGANVQRRNMIKEELLELIR